MKDFPVFLLCVHGETAKQKRKKTSYEVFFPESVCVFNKRRKVCISYSIFLPLHTTMIAYNCEDTMCILP